MPGLFSDGVLPPRVPPLTPPPSQKPSKRRTPPATTKAPGQGKMIGIQAGASRSTHVTRPGAASKRRAPNWWRAWSKADGVRMAEAAAMVTDYGWGIARGALGLDLTWKT